MKARVLVGVVLWLGVVAVGSGITWLVIDQVGRQVAIEEANGDSPVAGAAVTTPAPSASPSASAPPGGSATPRPSPGSTRSTTPGAVVTATPGTSTKPTAEPPAAKPPRTPTPDTSRTVTRTWSGSGGRLTVSCTGARAALVSASPADGWRVEIGDRGPDEVEVEFKQGEEGAETHVKSRCSAGEPRFSVEEDD